MSIWNTISEEFKYFPQELREKIRSLENEKEENIIRHERALSVIKATDAFLEEKIVLYILSIHSVFPRPS